MKTQGLHHAAPSFAVALSGGGDSMCLALVAHRWVQEHGGRVVTMTVDHGLRPESSAEAQQVQMWMQHHDIPHRILKWEGEKPETGLQRKARDARYELLTERCHQEGLSHLLLGHHQQDQHETFLMRLIRGSGNDGLGGMRNVTERNGVQILRPFLNLAPEALKYYLEVMQQTWIDDPSNLNTNFTRVRVRNFLMEEGLSASHLDQVLGNLQEDRDYFENAVAVWWSEHVSGQLPLYGHIASFENLLSQHPALGKRVLRRAIQIISGAQYQLGARQLEILWDALQQPRFNAITMGGCYLLKRSKGLHIQRERRALPGDLSWDNEGQLWDNRIDLSSCAVPSGSMIRPLPENMVPELKKKLASTIPTVVWPTLPSVWKDGELIYVPHLEDALISATPISSSRP